MWKILVRIIHVYYLQYVQSGPFSISSEPLFSECAVTLNKFSFKVKSQVLKLVKYPCSEYVYFLPVLLGRVSSDLEPDFYVNGKGLFEIKFWT